MGMAFNKHRVHCSVNTCIHQFHGRLSAWDAVRPLDRRDGDEKALLRAEPIPNGVSQAQQYIRDTERTKAFSKRVRGVLEM